MDNKTKLLLVLGAITEALRDHKLYADYDFFGPSFCYKAHQCLPLAYQEEITAWQVEKVINGLKAAV